MEQAVAGAAIIAVGGGLAFLAYHEPDTYQKLIGPLIAVIGSATILGIVWNSAIIKTELRLSPFINLEQTATSRESVASLYLNSWLLAVAVVAAAYIGILAWLADQRRK